MYTTFEIHDRIKVAECYNKPDVFIHECIQGIVFAFTHSPSQHNYITAIKNVPRKRSLTVL